MAEKELGIIDSLATSLLLLQEIEDLTPEQETFVWGVIDCVSEIFKYRKDDLRVGLFEVADEAGELTDKGHKVAVIDGTKVTKERKRARKPDEKAMEALLEELHMPVTEVFDEVVETKLILNQSKVEHLVRTGRLPKEKIEAMHKITYALKVKPSDELVAALDKIRARIPWLEAKKKK
jgi:hypothetical protein